MAEFKGCVDPGDALVVERDASQWEVTEEIRLGLSTGAAQAAGLPSHLAPPALRTLSCAGAFVSVCARAWCFCMVSSVSG